MKVLMVNKFLYPNGGSETYIFGLGSKLRDMGHEVQYFGMEHEGRIVGNRIESYTSNMDFHGGKLQKLLYPFKIIYSTEARKKLRLVLWDFCPDVVHLNNINFQLTPSIIYEIRDFEKKFNKKNKQSKSVRIIYTAHDYQWVCPNHMMMIPSDGSLCFKCRRGKFGECTTNRCIHDSRIKSMLGSMEAFYYKWRKTYDMVDVIICPSGFMKKQLDTNPILADKTVMMHNFLTETETETEQEPEPYVLYFGRFSREKGVETLLKVCGRLPHIPFVFAGTGPLDEEIRKYSNVKCVGFVRGMELKKLIAGARFSVYPSQWYENCPFSVMESQLYGTPVIASDIGGIPELIKDGVTGELFTPGDDGQLKEKIERLWERTEVCGRYRENCKNIKFDTIEEYCGKIIENVYRNKEGR